MKDICVFGGKGFVGSWFSEYASTKWNVKVVDRGVTVPTTGKIVNFISTVHNYNVFDNPHLDINTNLNHLITVLDSARKSFSEVEINYISSWFVYGKGHKSPISENVPCNPKGFYSITKHAAEELLQSYCDTFNLKYRILRLSNVIGVGDEKVSRKKNAIQKIIRDLCIEKRVDYLYETDSVRDFIDVRDAAKAIALVIDKGELNSTYNISNGAGISIHKVSKYVADRVDASLKMIPVPDFHKIVQDTDVYMDNTKLVELGYRQDYSIYDTVDWIMDNYVTDQR